MSEEYAGYAGILHRPRDIEGWMDSNYNEWKDMAVSSVMRKVRRKVVPGMHGFAWVYYVSGENEVNGMNAELNYWHHEQQEKK